MGCGCGKKNKLGKGASVPRQIANKVHYCVALPAGSKKEEECFLVLHEARRFARKKGYPKPVRKNRPI